MWYNGYGSNLKGEIIMCNYRFYIEKGTGDAYSIRICDERGELYRYFASVSTNYSLLKKIKEYFDAGDVSVDHIDDIICDIICL